jgi:hypothetical protein
MAERARLNGYICKSLILLVNKINTTRLGKRVAILRDTERSIRIMRYYRFGVVIPGLETEGRLVRSYIDWTAYKSLANYYYVKSKKSAKR